MTGPALYRTVVQRCRYERGLSTHCMGGVGTALPLKRRRAGAEFPAGIDVATGPRRTILPQAWCAGFRWSVCRVVYAQWAQARAEKRVSVCSGNELGKVSYAPGLMLECPCLKPRFLRSGL